MPRLILLSSLAVMAACTQPTGTLLLIDASGEGLRSRWATLDTTIYDSEGEVVDERTLALGPTATTLPVQMTLSPRGDDSARRWRVVAVLRDSAGNALAEIDTRGGYVEGEVREARVFFDDECEGVFECPDGRSCVRGSCLGACVNVEPRGGSGPSERVFCDGCGCTECERCGADGECEPLDELLRCDRGAGVCRAGSCCAGCWDGTSCRAGQDEAACGRRGTSCEACCGAESCEEGLCDPGNDAIISASAGRGHTCALARDRASPFCWGNIDDGAGAFADFGDSPSPFVTSENLFSLASGDHFVCAHTNPAQRIRCWGSDTAGQLGDGEGSPADPTDDVPIDVDGEVSWRSSLVAGEEHACALDTEGSAWCWGATRGRGQRVGLEEGTDSPRPVPGELAFTRLAAGEDFTCGLDERGQPHCWGASLTGAQGRVDGTPEYPIEPPRIDPWTPMPLPMHVEPADGWTDIAAGRYHTCLVHETGILRCVGGTRQGQLGSDAVVPTENTNEFVEVHVDGEDDSFFAVYAGGSITCALRDGDPVLGGELWCWGRNHYGQLGTGDLNTAFVPRRVGDHRDWVAVEVGIEHVCGLRTQGRFYCWGRDLEGQLGLGSPDDLASRPAEDIYPGSPIATSPRRVCLP